MNPAQLEADKRHHQKANCRNYSAPNGSASSFTVLQDCLNTLFEPVHAYGHRWIILPSPLIYVFPEFRELVTICLSHVSLPPVVSAFRSLAPSLELLCVLFDESSTRVVLAAGGQSVVDGACDPATASTGKERHYAKSVLRESKRHDHPLLNHYPIFPCDSLGA